MKEKVNHQSKHNLYSLSVDSGQHVSDGIRPFHLLSLCT